jgi:hypothetical protein
MDLCERFVICFLFMRTRNGMVSTIDPRVQSSHRSNHIEGLRRGSSKASHPLSLRLSDANEE